MKAKKVLASLLCLIMTVSLFPMSVFAAEGAASPVKYGYYNAEDTWVEGDLEQNLPDGVESVEKTAEQSAADPNVYDITLQVKTYTTTATTSPGAAATVLVIDTSGSMEYCAECGREIDWHYKWHTKDCPYYDNEEYYESRLEATQQAALDFLQAYSGRFDERGNETTETDLNLGRYVAIVSFATNATTRLGWVDISNKAGYDNAVKSINSLSAKGGTNLERGLYTANALMSDKAVSGIASEAKNVIALTDGEPTYYGDRPYGNGSSCNQDTYDATKATAKTLRSTATLYTVCFGVADYHLNNNSSNPTVGDFLKDSIASKGCAYNAANADGLNAAFAAITETIVSGISSGIVNDSLPALIAFEGKAPAEFSGANPYQWELKDAAGEYDEASGKTIYTYTLSYQVRIDVDDPAVVDGEYYPANGRTTLTVKNANGEDITVDFPVPAIQATKTRYTVTYLPGDNGALSGANAEGSVGYNDLLPGSDTPLAPEVEADEGYYFTGWEPGLQEKVSEDTVYTAQYEEQSVIVIKAQSATVTYDGTSHTVGYSVEGLPEGFSVTGVSASVTETDAGTYPNQISVKDFKVLNADDENVTYQFRYTVENGELVINPMALTITAESGSHVYTGAAFTLETWTAGAVAAGDTVTEVTVTGSQKDVGNSANIPSGAVIKNADGKNVTANYDITYVNGTLSVTPLSDGIIITANSSSKKYDGTPLTNDGYTYTQGILIEGDVLTAVVEGTQTDAGNSANTVTSYKVMRGETNVTANYTFGKSIPGTLTVEKRHVILTSATDSKRYNGTALTNDAITVSGDGWAEGEGATYVVTGSQTEVGSSENKFTYTLNDNTKADNYKIEQVVGKLVVTKRSSGSSPTPPALNSEKHYAYIVGYNDGLVHPEANISRAEVATIFFRLLKDSVREANITKTNTFSDVNETDWFCTAVSTMAKLGIINGYPNGSFGPNDPITRAEFAAIAARFDEHKANCDADFTDISGHWAALEISRAAELGWVNGYPDGTFHPNQNITRAEAMALVNRVLNRNPEKPADLLDNMIKWPDNLDTNAWYYLDIQEATNSHDYNRKANNFEKWIKITVAPDWTALEE